MMPTCTFQELLNRALAESLEPDAYAETLLRSLVKSGVDPAFEKYAEFVGGKCRKLQLVGTEIGEAA